MIIEAVPIKQIAAELNISRNTVGSYLATLYAKLGVHSRAEAALLGFRQRLSNRTIQRDKAA